MKFCMECGQPLVSRVLPGDHLPRLVCSACGTVHYRNPRIIVGCIVEAEDGRMLLGRRATEPRREFWTFPTGFLELGETGAAGAARETLEEMRADVEIGDLFAVFNVPPLLVRYRCSTAAA